MTDDPRVIAEGLTPDDVACLLDLVEAPHWRMGDATWRDHASREKFHALGLLDAVLRLGKRVASHLQRKSPS